MTGFPAPRMIAIARNVLSLLSKSKWAFFIQSIAASQKNPNLSRDRKSFSATEAPVLPAFGTWST
jgi:hypothetical protein